MANKTNAQVPQMTLEQEVQSLQAYAAEYTNQFTMFSEQLKFIGAAKAEAHASIETLKSMQAAKKTTTVLLPLGGGVAARAAVADTKTMLVSIGAGVTVEKSAEESISYLEDRITEMEASEKYLTESISKLQEQMRAVDARMQQIYATVQGQKQQQQAS